MAKVAPATVLWKQEPDEHDYPAATSYLSLVAEPRVAAMVVSRLQAADVVTFKAKDILRSSGLPLLPAENMHVAGDLKKVRKGVALSPVLLVRGDAARGVPSTVADGYHRVCASYLTDENTDIPCRVVGWPS